MNVLTLVDTKQLQLQLNLKYNTTRLYVSGSLIIIYLSIFVLIIAYKETLPSATCFQVKTCLGNSECMDLGWSQPSILPSRLSMARAWLA